MAVVTVTGLPEDQVDTNQADTWLNQMGATTTPNNPAATALVHSENATLMTSTYEWFKELVVSSGSGVIVERVDDAHVLAQLIDSIAYSEAWGNAAGSFYNAQKKPFDRNSRETWNFTEGKAEAELEIGALKLMGFLNCGTFIKPNSMQGLVFQFTLANASDIFTKGWDDPTVQPVLELSQV